MPILAECCVLIPCRTVEDFPSRMSSADARGLLGGLTAAWHPRIVAALGRLPDWHRADDWPPRPVATSAAPNSASPPARLILVPTTCLAKLPAELRQALQSDVVIDAAALGVLSESLAGAQPRRDIVVRVGSRDEALAAIERWAANCHADQATDQPAGRLAEALSELTAAQSLFFSSGDDDRGRTIAADDFFALGYTWWQIQTLTRRLRYTSNLDAVSFERQVVAAAVAFVAGDAGGAAEGLHDAYDALAEERDHYFSSDPSLIDLTLLTPATLPRFWGSGSLATAPPDDSVLATPRNVLVDDATASHLLAAESTGDGPERLRTLLDDPNWGWAGGGPSGEVRLDSGTLQTLEQTLADSLGRAASVTGRQPDVYARLAGGTPPEAIPGLVAREVAGLISIDFVHGRGSSGESKVIVGSGGQELEALSAKPIDASDDAEFLTLAVRLGEAIDGGEVATGLLVHWPGDGCDSFHDVRRAASWTLALGRFWTLPKYFREGEHPYHSHELSSITDDPTTVTLGDLRALVGRWREQCDQQHHRNATGVLRLIAPPTPATILARSELPSLAERLGGAMGIVPANQDSVGAKLRHDAVLLVNATGAPVRTPTRLRGRVRMGNESVFYCASRRGVSELLVDVPAWGFANVSSRQPVPAASAVTAESSHSSETGGTATANPPPSRWRRWAKMLGRSFSRRGGPLVVGPSRSSKSFRLSNEFMEVTVAPDHGGITGVYSGATRGNRCSTRLIVGAGRGETPVTAVCEAMRMDLDPDGTGLAGRLVMEGTLAMPAGPSTNGDHLGPAALRWQAELTIRRGSRTLDYRVRFDKARIADDAIASASLWRAMPTLRLAFAEASPIVRVLMRDKLHRTSAKQFLSPSGYVVEEDERATLVATRGNALHRRSDDRFFDTLLVPETKSVTASHDPWTAWCEVTLGFDVPQPIAVASNGGSGVIVVPYVTAANPVPLAARSWLLHTAPTGVLAQFVDVACLADGQWAIHLRLVQTRAKAVRGVVRFCRDVQSATRLRPLLRPLAVDSTASLVEPKTIEQRVREAETSGEVVCRGDAIEVPLTGHGVVHVLVRFPAPDAR